ncbi:hypothetical protein RHS04_07788 [Rhizoctonia solani]|uniref:Uncharacterized protein n=1 Tax=Rhizoctonia solani TaxID=456999 RepID=A0A8H7H1M4_9AGAM|nr:hypothetical protein RHS04_07788 [Rhizoctonia solani]
MKLTNLVLFALSSVSVAFGQTAGAAPANDALALVSKCNNDLQAGPPGEITSKLTGLTVEIKSLCSALQADPEMGLEMRSKIAVQMATMIKYVAHEGMSVGPGALGGNMQSALKALLEEMRVCVPGVDKETSRVLVDIPAQVFLKNNAGDALAVLSEASRDHTPNAADGNGIKLGLGLGVSIEL